MCYPPPLLPPIIFNFNPFWFNNFFFTIRKISKGFW